jgi:hypothetical protein
MRQTSLTWHISIPLFFFFSAVVPEKQDDILTQIANILIQMAIEFLATGTISQASLDLLTELLLHAEIVEVLQILETLVGLLPQEMIDFLVDLGILPPTAKGRFLTYFGLFHEFYWSSTFKPVKLNPPPPFNSCAPHEAGQAG